MNPMMAGGPLPPLSSSSQRRLWPGHFLASPWYSSVRHRVRRPPSRIAVRIDRLPSVRERSGTVKWNVPTMVGDLIAWAVARACRVSSRLVCPARCSRRRMSASKEGLSGSAEQDRSPWWSRQARRLAPTRSTFFSSPMLPAVRSQKPRRIFSTHSIHTSCMPAGFAMITSARRFGPKSKPCLMASRLVTRRKVSSQVGSPVYSKKNAAGVTVDFGCQAWRRLSTGTDRDESTCSSARG